MDKSFSTILELRWGGKNPRIIFDDGMNMLFYANGDKHNHWVIWQEKEGLKDFYYADPDRYHGSLWFPETDFGLCKWVQSVTLALGKNGIGKKEMYLATREIFEMKDDPTEEKVIEKIFDILRKHFGVLIGKENFNYKPMIWKDDKVIDSGYDFKYRYDGIRDLVYLFLTGYAFHYGNCIRQASGYTLFNRYKTLKYKDLFYRSCYYVNIGVDIAKCAEISKIYFKDSTKMETDEQASDRMRESILYSEIGVESIITTGRINAIMEDKKKEIIEKIDKEILENENEEKNICNDLEGPI